MLAFKQKEKEVETYEDKLYTKMNQNSEKNYG